MSLLVFVVLLGTVVTVNSAQPEVEMHSDITHVDDVGAETDHHRMLTCRARGFITSDIILNIKKNGFIQSNGDGVETSGVQPDKDKTYWRRDYVIIPHSEVSDYSCEVVHASSSFRVEKVWDPDSDGGEQIISSKFIDTTPPEVKIFTDNSTDETNVFLTCLASGFYPHNITLNMKRNRRILTREDGVKSSGVRPYKDDTFQRRDGVEIKKSDKSHYSCEVIHGASGSRAEKFWGQPEVKLFAEDCKGQTNIIVMCLASGFYPNNIIMNMKRNGRILTREDGVESSRVSPIGQRAFQKREHVEIKKSDKSDFSCEVIHDASCSHVEKFWDHPPLPHSDGAAVIIGPVVGGVLLLVLVLVLVVLVVLKKRGIRGAAKNKTNYSAGGAPAPEDPPSGFIFGGNGVSIPLMDETKESKTSVDSDNSSDSGHGGSQHGDSGSDSDSGSPSGSPTPSIASPSDSPDSGNDDEGENS